MKANNQDMILDIQKLSLATLGSTGLSESSLHFTSLSDLLVGASFTAKIINEHKSNYMIDHPFFYKNTAWERWNKMAVSEWSKDRKNPFTWFHGKNSNVLNGAWYTSLDNTCPTIYNHMEIYTNYMNNLNIRKNDQADNYINTSLIPQLKTQYPWLSDAEYNNMAKTYFWLYATRGNIDALAYQNRHAIKDPLITFVNDSYKNTKNFIKPHYDTIKQRTTERTEKWWNKIKNNAIDIYNDAGDLKTRISNKRDTRDVVLRWLVKESWIALDKIENLTFNQLPQWIWNLIANIILWTGRIVYQTWKGVVDGVKDWFKEQSISEIQSIKAIENIRKDFSDAQIKTYQSILPKLKINWNNLELSWPSSIEDIKKFWQILIYHYNGKSITPDIIDGKIWDNTIANLQQALQKYPNNLWLQQIQQIINTYTNKNIPPQQDKATTTTTSSTANTKKNPRDKR
jgi:hypothetical protein